MAEMQNPAGGDGRVREGKSPAGDTSHYTIASAEYQLIAKIRKNAREEFRIAHRQFKNFRGVELRIFRLNGEGTFVETSRVVALRQHALPDIIAALQSALEPFVGSGGPRGE